MSAGASPQQTHVAVLTATGRSAVAVIGVAGPGATAAVDRFFQAANERSLSQQRLNKIVYGHWGSGAAEDVVVCCRETGSVEIHCHGGVGSISLITEQLISAGCKQISWQQWLTARSASPLTTAAHVALTKAPTLRTAMILLDQYHGALQKKLDSICLDLKSGSLQPAQDRLQELLNYADIGSHLTQPWQVVLAGLPNVGKSSLINALVGFRRAVVFDEPGTTRDVVTATTAASGWPLQLSDTAGLRSATDDLEDAGISQAHCQLQDADLVLWVVDASQFNKNSEQSVGEAAREQKENLGANFDWSRAIVIANKIDLVDRAAEAPLPAISTSAVTGEGVVALLDTIANHVAPAPPHDGAAVPFTTDQIGCLQEAIQCCQRQRPAEAESLLAQLLS